MAGNKKLLTSGEREGRKEEEEVILTPNPIKCSSLTATEQVRI